MAEIVGGGTPSTGNPEYWNGDIDWYSPTEIGDHVYARGSTKKITKLGLEKSSAKILPQDKTVLFTSRAGIGDMAILQRPGATNQGFQSLVLKEEIDTYFIYSMGHLIKKYAEKNASGSTFLEISGRTLGDMPILMPSTNEQTQIGTFFKTLDNLITLHQRKCDKLIIFKKAMLEKMFPKNGENLPEVRFEGFNDDWEQRKVAYLIKDNFEKTTTQNQYPVLTSSQQQGIVFQEDYFADRQVTTNDNVGYYVLPRGYFTYRSRSDTDLFVFNRNNLIDKGIISYYYPVFKSNKTDSNFLLRRLNHGIKKQLSMAAEGTGQKVLAHSKFKDMVVDVPTYNEQVKIGLLFETLDKLITLHQGLYFRVKAIKRYIVMK